MIEIEIDGTKIQVAEGSMVMDAASRLDIYIPHFCYHKKLTIAANCRMCLVEVEKAPKPLPACATPVAPGMIVRTASAKAKQAQQSVMEFLLINHPLDCPICDQGGECQLQDLAVGYGGSASRYAEPKRVVFRKNIGPLVAAEEMSRCIQCTRCVRFGQEIAGVMELGLVGRGEHSEIMSFVDRAVESEISGNMIDICPVGALTSKPFRYQARTWELARRRTVSGHDSLGSNLIVQVKNQRVLRVVPFENEAVNSCWLSDRDRFSYEGLYAADRLMRPMLKEGGQWREVDWRDALDFVAVRLRAVVAARGGDALGALAGQSSTLEEFALLARLVRGLGSDNIDFRLRHSDDGASGRRAGIPWLGQPVAQLERLDRVLVIGSFLRKDHPLLAVRLREAARRGARIGVVHAVDDDPLMPIAGRIIVRPDGWIDALAQIAAAVAAVKGVPAPAATGTANEAARAIAQDLCSGKQAAVLLGNAALQSPQAAQLQVWAQWIADATGATLGVLGEAAGSVGGYLANAVPQAGGRSAVAMLAQPRSAYLLWNLEPEYDTGDPATAMKAIGQAEFVVAFSPYRNGALEYAEAILPIATFFETSGTFVNIEGRVQGFNGACRPVGDGRPGWKVLRVLGNLLGLPGFDAETSEAVRDEVLPREEGALAARLSNRIDLAPAASPAGGGAQRVADVPCYFTDAIVRRAEALRATRDARPPRAGANAATLAGFGVSPGDKVRARQGDAAALLECELDPRLPDGVVRIPAGHAATSTLGAQFGPIVLERA
jgi:NADH-quinone oxidoreductase subunit G